MPDVMRMTIFALYYSPYAKPHRCVICALGTVACAGEGDGPKQSVFKVLA